MQVFKRQEEFCAVKAATLLVKPMLTLQVMKQFPAIHKSDPEQQYVNKGNNTKKKSTHARTK